MPNQCLCMHICGATGNRETNTLIHMLLDHSYIVTKYIYTQNSWNKIYKIADKHLFLLEDKLFSSNDEIIPVNEIDSAGQN